MIKLKLPTRFKTLLFCILLAFSIKAQAQQYINWGTIPGGTFTISGTYPNAGIATATLNGNDHTFNSPAGNIGNLLTTGTNTFATARVPGNTHSDRMRFTFSTPVIVTKFNVADIDLRLLLHNDSFNFTGIIFRIVNAMRCNATTTSATAILFLPNNQSAEYAHWRCSTEAVNGFTINFTNPFNLNHENLRYAIEVLPLPQVAPICQNTTPPAFPVVGNGIIGTWNPATINTSTVGTFPYTFTPNPGQIINCPFTINVDILPAPTITIGTFTQLPICSGAPTTLTANGAGVNATYLWNTGATTASITVNPVATTTYTVTATNASNCSSTTSTEVTVKPRPTLNLTAGSNINCITSGSPVVLTASGDGTSYAWSTGQTTSSITVSPTTTTTYSVTSTLAGCTTTKTITVTVGCPYISQVYSGVNANDKYVEVKNADNSIAITPGMYYLVWYENGAATPTSFVDLGTIPAKGAKVFGDTSAVNPTYAVSISNPWAFQDYDGVNDLVIISTSNGANAINDLIDIVGDNTTNSIFYKDYTLESYASLVRVSCMPAIFQPPRAVYDEQDWVGFSDTEVAIDTDRKNSILGRHYSDQLVWSGLWQDQIAFIDPANGSNPDRSREELITTPYDTSVSGNFEACSLQTDAPLTITASKYSKIQVSVTSTQPNGIDIQNKGALVMVRDSYYLDSNQQLIDISGNNNNNMQHTRKTVGLNRGSDYVYWSSPLSLNGLNPKASEIFDIADAVGKFDPNRFFRFENQNFYDKNNVYGDNGSGTDGYDDDAGYNQDPDKIDYLPFSRTIPDARNEKFIPGRGYVTYPPRKSYDFTDNYFTPYLADYSITFKGEFNNGVVEVPVYRNDSVNGGNVNLIGNPYPSAIDLLKLFEKNSTLIEPLALIWGRAFDDTPNGGNTGPDGYNYTADNYFLYNPTMIIDNAFTNNAPFNGTLPIDEQGILSSCQSFFVRAYDPVGGFATQNTGLIEEAGKVVFSNGMREELRNDTFARTTNSNRNAATNNLESGIDGKLWVNLSDNDHYTAQLGIAFANNGHSGYELGEDIMTIAGRKYNFYTQSTPNDLIIDIQDSFDANKIIPLGIVNISQNQQQSFSISIPKSEGLFENQTVYLYDALLNITHNLTNGAYGFTTQGSIIEGRFYLMFSDISSKLVENKSVEDVNLFSKNGTLTIQANNQDIKAVQVLDIYNVQQGVKTVASLQNINKKSISIPIDENHSLLEVKIILENGKIISKKVYR